MYGLGDLDDGQDVSQLSARMSETLNDMASEQKFPFEEIFDSSLPKCTLRGNALEKVKQALEKSAVQNGCKNIFVDTSSSEGWGVEECTGVSTCVRPSHPIYSVQLGRNLTVQEMFHCQGIWKDDFLNPQAVEHCLEKPGKAQVLAGNAFASTVAQAQLLASLVHARGWKTITNTGDAVEDLNACPPLDDALDIDGNDDSQNSAGTDHADNSAKKRINDFFDASSSEKRARFTQAPACERTFQDQS